MSLSEIYVPYGIPDPNWAWRAALDVGEYNLGQYSEPLAKNVDVPDNAVFFNVANQYNDGKANTAFPSPHAVAMYERDGGVLWDRTDPTTLARDARFSRELVVTSSMPIGNYTYAFDYIFRMDGGIDVEVHATGTTLNQGISSASEGDANGTTVTTTIAAPNHQHFFSFRIDFDVDGTNDRLLEQSVQSAPSSTGNAFVATTTPIDAEGFRDGADNRSWIVQSSTQRNALGKPTGYSLIPGEQITPLSDPSFPMLAHAEFATHQLWVTRYADNQLYAAGDYPNQAGPGEGLPQYIAGHRDIQDQDLVVWYTAGFTHIPVPEEYPVMTTDTTSFSIRPNGFFDANPALDAP
jgi:primary-amine oxidase